MGEQWYYLPPEVELQHGIDSWHIRAQPDFSAKSIGLLRPGQKVRVASRRGDWLHLAGSSDTEAGWVCCKLNPKHGSDDVVLVPFDATALSLESVDEHAQPPLERTRSNAADVQQLLEELKERRSRLAALGNSMDAAKFEAAREVQRVLDQLAIFGIGPQELSELEDVPSLFRSTSVPHNDFSNPRLESCWLSTFFQSLWHSRVFRAVYEELIRPSQVRVGKNAVFALRQTWDLYEEAAAEGETVSVGPLVRVWGKGYGDCTEALAKLQHDSSLTFIDGFLSIVPVPWTGLAPVPESLARLTKEMGVERSPLVAMDIVLHPMSETSIQRLALGIGLGAEAMPEPDRKGLRTPAKICEHLQLVAVICFMEKYKHYVVFCRSLSGDADWLFFNDLPGTGVHHAQQRVSGWDEVAQACARFAACPKMLLYENPIAARAFISQKRNAAVKQQVDEAERQATEAPAQQPPASQEIVKRPAQTCWPWLPCFSGMRPPASPVARTKPAPSAAGQPAPDRPLLQ